MITRWRCTSNPGTRTAGTSDDDDLRGQLLQLLVWIEPFHGDQPAPGRDKSAPERGKRREIGKGSRDDDIEQRLGVVVLGALVGYPDIAEPELDDRLPQERRLLVVAVEQHDAPTESCDGERNARQPAATADVENAQGALFGKVRQHRQRVEQMVRHHLPRIADRGEVVRTIPFVEQGDVLRQPGTGFVVRVEPERGKARGQRLDHAENLRAACGCARKPRLR